MSMLRKPKTRAHLDKDPTGRTRHRAKKRGLKKSSNSGVNPYKDRTPKQRSVKHDRGRKY